VLELEFVDETRTISNDMFEVVSVLGIEAARQVVINEVVKVIENQGLNIDPRHIMLVADMMSTEGTIKGITRYGIVSEKASVLARASFETPIKHLINAALLGEVDPLNAVVENVMLNQHIPVGTGLPGLALKKEESK
jgi:DNA-directed RNA polymerase subunit A"